MDSRQRRTLATFRHVLAYLDGHAPADAPPLLDTMRRRLTEVTERLGELAAAKVAAKHDIGGGARVRQRQRTQLRREMMALVRIVKPLLKFAPGEQALTVPHARADSATVAAAVIAMTEALAPHGELLESAGYSAADMKALREEAQRAATAVKQLDEARAERSRATAETVETVKEGMRAVTVIEGLLMRSMGKDQYKLWRNRRRVSKRMGRPKRKPAKNSQR